MKIKYAMIIALSALLYACGGNEPKKAEDSSKPFDLGDDKKTETKYADDKKGIGKFKDIQLGATLDQGMVSLGKKAFDVKCSSCHKLTGEKLVGPGWKGVTSRRKAEWVMNFVTNTDEMISKDPAAQSMLEECLVRMPNQNLSDADARGVYEFMRQNDGVK